jgi:hypothetical protein
MLFAAFRTTLGPAKHLPSCPLALAKPPETLPTKLVHIITSSLSSQPGTTARLTKPIPQTFLPAA